MHHELRQLAATARTADLADAVGFKTHTRLEFYTAQQIHAGTVVLRGEQAAWFWRLARRLRAVRHDRAYPVALLPPPVLQQLARRLRLQKMLSVAK